MLIFPLGKGHSDTISNLDEAVCISHIDSPMVPGALNKQMFNNFFKYNN